jgi:hypothetical protein
LFDVDVPLVTKKSSSVLKMRAAFRDRSRVVEKLPELVDRVADVGAQQVLAEELVEHLADRTLQERDAARVAGTMPRVRAVVRIMDERPKERRRQRIEVRPRFAQDVARDELRRVLVHVDEAVQVAQDVVGDVARRPRLAEQEHRDLGVAKADLVDERAQLRERVLRLLRRRGELLVVDRQDERRRATLLLREPRHVAVARDAEHVGAFVLERLAERANAESARVLGAVILVDDDDREAEFHSGSPGRRSRRRNSRTDPNRLARAPKFRSHQRIPRSAYGACSAMRW